MSNYDFFEPKFVGIEKDVNPTLEQTEQANPQRYSLTLTPKYEKLPKGYCYKIHEKGYKNGLYKIIQQPQDKEPNLTRIGDILYFKGFIRDNINNNWGIVCEWYDPDNILHQEILFFDATQSINSEWYPILASGGYRGNRKELAVLLSELDTKKRFTLVDVQGWHKGNYVLPHKTIANKQNQENFILNSKMAKKLYTQSGNIKQWNEVKMLIQGNTRLEFAYLAAFAGVLLHFLDNSESGGFALEGFSSCGKTTALQIASAVWGGQEHIHQWRTTSNALEGQAVLHNDNILILDELGQANAKDINEAIYMLANGQGKGRANKHGESKQAKKWNLLFLSSGELGFSKKLLEAGIKSKAGQEVRYIGIPTQKEHIESLHGLESSQILIDRIKELLANNYGFEGTVFISNVVDNYTHIRQTINKTIHNNAKNLYDGTNAQIKRVAKKFALLEYVRFLLEHWGMIKQGFAINCIRNCFTDWLNEFSNDTDSHEEQLLIENALNFISVHGSSRFQKYPEQQINNRAGFVETIKNKTVFFIFPSVFKKEICCDFKTKDVCEKLLKHGYLYVGGNVRGFQVRRYFAAIGATANYYALVMGDKKENT